MPRWYSKTHLDPFRPDPFRPIWYRYHETCIFLGTEAAFGIWFQLKQLPYKGRYCNA